MQLPSILRKLLASEYVLYTKLLGFHWNHIGNDFSSFHPYLWGLADEVSDTIDVLAERIRFKGEIAPGSLMELLADSWLDEVEWQERCTCDVSSALQTDLDKLINAYTKAISVAENECKVTSNILQDIADKRMKMKYFIDSTLKSNSQENTLTIKVNK